MSVKHIQQKLFIALLIAMPVHALANGWSYAGQNAPEHWADIDPTGGSDACLAGEAQSPVDVDLHKLEHQPGLAKDLTINYQRSALQLVNNRHSIQANLQPGNSLIFKGSSYNLVQFHFHTPSEHQFNDKNFPMEMHLVNQAEDGRLLVMAVMIKQGEANTELDHLWKMLPQKAGQAFDISEPLAPDLTAILPSNSKHLLYTGSLTTPPCTEGVQWVLFEQPIEMSAAQIKAFQQLYADNHRPIKPLNSRQVIED